jgi:hypothetical protein
MTIETTIEMTIEKPERTTGLEPATSTLATSRSTS